MLYVYVLATAFVTSTVFGRSPVAPTPPRTIELEYENLNVVSRKDETSKLDVKVATVDGHRLSNLKYVTVLQNSTIWSAIKKRTLAIKAVQPQLAEIIDKSPEQLSDQELAELRKACNDGLKCVAVDQLLVLKTVTEPTGGGKVSVRTAITKIIKVLTQYTTEYHQDKAYEYKEVDESDEPAKVSKLVTTIVEDNKELCQIEIGSSSSDEHKENTKVNNASTTPVNVDTPNHSSINNYKINNGTINDATINVLRSDQTANGDSTSEPEISDKVIPDVRIIYAVDPHDGSTNKDIPAATRNQISGIQIDPSQRDKSPINNGTIAKEDDSVGADKLAVISVTSAPDGTFVIDASNNNTFNFVNTDGSSNANTPASVVDDKPENTENVGNKDAELKNVNLGNEEDSSSKSDLVAKSSFNKNSTNNGYGEKEGILNNAKNRTYNINHGVINKGIITTANAANGIINVGTVNNGPTNYGTINDFTDNGTDVTTNHININQFTTSIDEIYSTILKKFAENN